MRTTYITVCRCLLSLLLLFGSFGLATGQQLILTESDKQEIKRRAQFRIQEFEELLQLISDPTRSRGAIDRYILSSYTRQDSLFNQVFYDENVIIEDDITPIDLTSESIEVSALKVPTYLNNFKLQYKKYTEKTIFFTNVRLSDVRQQNFIYVLASYESEFRGRNNVYKNHQYAPVKRRATLRAEYSLEKDRWQVWIAGVTYARNTSEDLDADSTSEDEDNISAQEEVTLNKVEEASEATEPVENNESGEIEVVNTLSFEGSMPEVIKKGTTTPLRWNENIDDAEIRLYQGDVQKTVLRKGLNGQQWNWPVQQKPGRAYSIMLYEPTSGRETRSQTFQIKPKFPLALKIGIPLVAVAAAVYFLQPSDLSDPQPPITTPSIDYTIDIAPSLPGN